MAGISGIVYNSSGPSKREASDACETFLESYAGGNIDFGGIEVPEIARSEIPVEVFSSGHFAPPSPPDEAQRVRELYQYRVLRELNHDIKLGFDKFARLATLVCDAKISIVNFLDDKIQYTSAECSPTTWLNHVPVDKKLSICAHTILRRSGDVFEIPDTTKDWRFKGKPYVTGKPYIRYYAGAPLRTRSGYNIGSLCILDYVPKILTQQQVSVLMDLANMIMNELELYREKELVGLKKRMANSITQFTRGPINCDTDVDGKGDSSGPHRGRHARKSSQVRWMKHSRGSDKIEEEKGGVMGWVKLGESQKAVDEGDVAPEETGDDITDAESVFSQSMDELDLKAIYRYACRLMRETLDIEGVCFVDIDGINWKQVFPNHVDSTNAQYGFSATSSILGYSHGENFKIDQHKNGPSISRWDEGAELSNPQIRDGSPNRRRDEPLDAGFPHSTGRFSVGSYVSAMTGSHFDNGRFSDQFLATFLSENPYGRIYNEGLPEDVSTFLPSGITSAILVPIYDFDQKPFAMTCAYSTNKQKWFVEAEQRYLEGFGSQILSQVFKKRIIMADRAKGTFIANISHELRSPLHGILASAEFLTDTRLDTLQQTFIDTIDSCGRTLLEVINHVLDFGKLSYITRFKTNVAPPHIPQPMDTTPVDLMAVTEQVVESCYGGHEFKGLLGQVDIGSLLDEGQKSEKRRMQGYGRAKDPTSALTVVVDVDYREQGWFFLFQTGAIQRILMNITGNALKYTPAGWVRIQLSAEDNKTQTTIHLIVSDSGKGISAEFLKNHLFSPFSQEDTLQAGTGLGMSIVKQVVDRLGGDVNVTSQVNVGTQVHVSLPAIPVSRPRNDSCTRVRSLTENMKVFLAGFNKSVPAGKLLYNSITHYVTTWYNMLIVDDVHSSNLIISDECPELLDYFQQHSPTDRSAFAPSPTTFLETSANHSVYRAWQPLIVLCSNALRYEFFGQQAEAGKIIDFSSKPCGPYKLARSILFCLEQVETRQRGMENEGVTPPKSSLSSPTEEESPVSEPSHRRGSFGKGVVRFSPTPRHGSSDTGASMYVPGRGFVPTTPSSIVELQKFVGLRRKTPASSQFPRAYEEEEENESEGENGGKSSAESPLEEKQEQTRNGKNPSSTSSMKHKKIELANIALSRLPHVLVVEDNSVNAMILATFLRKRGYPFAQAENGLLAVQEVHARPRGFDVILMDMQMPVMNGPAATAAIRNIEKERRTSPPSYIIALTGLAADNDRQLAFDSGVDHFLTKPVSLRQLGVVIDDWENRDTA